MTNALLVQGSLILLFKRRGNYSELYRISHSPNMRCMVLHKCLNTNLIELDSKSIPDVPLHRTNKSHLSWLLTASHRIRKKQLEALKLNMKSCYWDVTNEVGWVLITCNPLLTELYKDTKKTLWLKIWVRVLKHSFNCTEHVCTWHQSAFDSDKNHCASRYQHSSAHHGSNVEETDSVIPTSSRSTT